MPIFPRRPARLDLLAQVLRPIFPRRAARLEQFVAVPEVTPGTLREAIYARLATSPALTDLVDERVGPAKRAQGEPLPSVQYHVITNKRGHVFGGSAGWSRARVQFDCTAEDLATAEQLAAAIVVLFDSQQFTSAGLMIRWSRQVEDHDMHEFADTGSDDSVYRIVSDYMITYKVQST